MSRIYLALDPGRDKVGMALGESPDAIIWQTIVERGEAVDTIRRAMEKYPSLIILLGDGTSSTSLLEELKNEGLLKEYYSVDEARSTEEGRRLYFQENPPQGLRRFLPLSMQSPPIPWDDYAARILFYRFFFKKNL